VDGRPGPLLCSFDRWSRIVADARRVQHDPDWERIDTAVFALVPEFGRASIRVAAAGAPAATTVRAFLQGAGRRAARAGAETQGALSWRGAYERVGLDAATVPPHEALAAWARTPDGVPSMDVVTDLAHAFSLVHGLPAAAYDASAARGGLWLRPARGHEVFVATGGAAESPPINELILVDGDDRVLARRWHGSSGWDFAPGGGTAQVHLDVLAADPEGTAARMAALFSKLARACLGGTVSAQVLWAGRPAVRWGAE
jgi:DNA/RNA-binding domain of Phe-tRNA-synthetase-like protein